MVSYQNLYDSVIGDLKNEIDEENFKDLSLEGKKINRFLNGYIYIIVDDEFIESRVNKFYLKKINKYVEKYTDENFKFKFIVKDKLKDFNDEQTPVSPEDNIEERYRPGNIDATYNFSNFVVGSSNRFAYTCALQVSDNPGVINPLYIFGGVGLGKTHLMESIGNYIMDKDINQKVLYVDSAKFREDYVKCCSAQQAGDKQKRLDEFRNKYRSVDVLLVDDIQILCNSDKTQEEFFSIFNYLTNLNKQIVITCDRLPKQLDGMVDRLKSRFDQGLSVDINAPELELRINILKKKLKTINNKTDIDDEVLKYIASYFTSNIRELEGALKRVIYFSVLCNSDVTLKLAEEALKPLIEVQNKANKLSTNNKSYEDIQSIVADYYKITVSDLIGKNRSRKYNLPRQIAMYLIKDIYNLPYAKIGSLFDGRDHSTVINACENIEASLVDDPNLKLAVENIRKKIKK